MPRCASISALQTLQLLWLIVLAMSVSTPDIDEREHGLTAALVNCPSLEITRWLCVEPRVILLVVSRLLLSLSAAIAARELSLKVAICAALQLEATRRRASRFALFTAKFVLRIYAHKVIFFRFREDFDIAIKLSDPDYLQKQYTLFLRKKRHSFYFCDNLDAIQFCQFLAETINIFRAHQTSFYMFALYLVKTSNDFTAYIIQCQTWSRHIKVQLSHQIIIK